MSQSVPERYSTNYQRPSLTRYTRSDEIVALDPREVDYMLNARIPEDISNLSGAGGMWADDIVPSLHTRSSYEPPGVQPATNNARLSAI